jgi:hypothetical protein
VIDLDEIRRLKRDLECNPNANVNWKEFSFDGNIDKETMESIADYWAQLLEIQSRNKDVIPLIKCIKSILNLSLLANDPYPIYVTDGWLSESISNEHREAAGKLIQQYKKMDTNNSIGNALDYLAMALSV